MGHAQRTADERPQDTAEDMTICGGDDFLAERGIADPDEFRVKSHLCHEIASIVEARKLTQAAAAELTGQKQSDLSRIINHRHNDYSVWRLMKMLSALGADTFTHSRIAAELSVVLLHTCVIHRFYCNFN